MKVVVYEATQSSVYGYDKTKITYDRCRGFKTEIICAVIKHMNASFVTKFSGIVGMINEEGKPYGMIKDVLSCTVDLSINNFFSRDYWKMQAYPLESIALKMVSLKNSVTYADRLLYIFNVKVLVLFVFTCLILIIFLKYNLHQSISKTILDFLRMFISTSTLKEPQEFLGKLFFLTLMFAVFIISSCIQSDLDAISTVPDRIPAIDSMEFMRSDLPIYGMPQYKKFLSNKRILARYHDIVDYKECVDRLYKNEHVICIFIDSFSKYYINEDRDIHISKDDVVQRHSTYIFKEDSPLLYDFNRILFRMAEGGFIQLFIERDKRFLKKKQDKNDVGLTVNADGVITPFCILITGLTIALSAFLVKITSNKIKRIDLQVSKLRTSITNGFRRMIRKLYLLSHKYAS